MSTSLPNENLLGTYLRDRRARLDPTELGLPGGRRRTPGLRREEVAQRANISTTWYICLEQGRGGPPSSDVLDRLSRALALTASEREHLYLLGLGRPPQRRYEAWDGEGRRLQRILDALSPAPAFIKTATWDVAAWNDAAAAVLADYGSIAPENRNMLRYAFLGPRARPPHRDWRSVARAMVAAFRAETAKAGAMADARALVDDLCRLSPEFREIWSENEVLEVGAPLKHFHHAELGPLSFECSSFAVDRRQDLTMQVFYPVEAEHAEKIGEYLVRHPRVSPDG